MAALDRTRYDAVAFDLLTALIDSWTLWNRAAGSEADGLRWRRAYLRLTYGCGACRPYEDLVRAAAGEAGLGAEAPARLAKTWDRLEPWPEATGILQRLAAGGLPLGVATNCSVALGTCAAGRLGVPFTAARRGRAISRSGPRPIGKRRVSARP